MNICRQYQKPLNGCKSDHHLTNKVNFLGKKKAKNWEKIDLGVRLNTHWKRWSCQAVADQTNRTLQQKKGSQLDNDVLQGPKALAFSFRSLLLSTLRH